MLEVSTIERTRISGNEPDNEACFIPFSGGGKLLAISLFGG